MEIPRPTRLGWALLLPAAVLCALGVLTLQAVDAPAADHLLGETAARQIIYIAVGLGAMLAVMILRYHRLGRLAYLLFTASLALLAYLLLERWIDVPFVAAKRNALRWLLFGPVPVQPSELAKITYILALAWYLRYRRNYRTLPGLIIPFTLTLIPMALILLQPDLGTVLLFPPVLFAMLYAAGARSRHLLVIILLGVLCLPAFWQNIAEYQRLRIAGVLLQSQPLREYLAQPPESAFFKSRPTRWDWLRHRDSNPHLWQRELLQWQDDAGYQLLASKTAVGSGGWTGLGWGRGVFFEYDFLPEKHNDFIFALLANQWGLAGGLAVLLCYVVIVVTGFVISTTTADPFGRLIAVGLAALLAGQTLTNVAMTVGLGPVTGMTLPLVSAGGSSLVASFAGLGLLISVARDRPILIARPPFEFERD